RDRGARPGEAPPNDQTSRRSEVGRPALNRVASDPRERRNEPRRLADTLFSAGTLAGPMGWRGLLRVVDFQTVLTSQPAVAAALDKAQRAGGTKSPEAKALREGYQLVAKVLWTRRASIPRVPDPQLRSLYDWAAKTKFNAPPAAISVLGEVEALSAAARRGAGPSVAVVFAGYSFEDVAAE